MNKTETGYLYKGKSRVLLKTLRLVTIPIGLFLSVVINYIAFKVTFTGTIFWFKTFIVIVTFVVLVAVVFMHIGFGEFLKLTYEDIRSGNL